MAKKKDSIPEEIDAELKAPKFGKPKTHTASGYFLDINEKENKVDIQVLSLIHISEPTRPY